MMVDSLRKELIKIAHSYRVTCRFSSRVKIPYADPISSHIVLSSDSRNTQIALSEFFHELGHVVDYRNGLYKAYYKRYPTNKALRRFALRAELHTDETGAKLMRKHYPRIKFEYTYKYKKWQKFLRNYWGIE